jgi:hypothetical protein
MGRTCIRILSRPSRACSRQRIALMSPRREATRRVPTTWTRARMFPRKLPVVTAACRRQLRCLASVNLKEAAVKIRHSAATETTRRGPAGRTSRIAGRPRSSHGRPCRRPWSSPRPGEQLREGRPAAGRRQVAAKGPVRGGELRPLRHQLRARLCFRLQARRAGRRPDGRPAQACGNEPPHRMSGRSRPPAGYPGGLVRSSISGVVQPVV